VILAVVLLAARLAPELATVASIPLMKVIERFLQPATSASLHVCQIRLQSVADGANGPDTSL